MKHLRHHVRAGLGKKIETMKELVAVVEQKEQDRKQELDALLVERMALGAFPGQEHNTAPVVDSGNFRHFRAKSSYHLCSLLGFHMAG